MSWKVTSAPGSEPLTISNAKTYLKVDTPADDTLITTMIAAARHHVEDYLGQALITQTIEEVYDGFPIATSGNPDAAMFLTVHPVQSVTSIQYVDTDGNTQTLNSSKYIVDTHRKITRIAPAYGETWPTTRAQINAVTVTYDAGYGDAASDVPESVLQAMYLLVADMYHNRTDSVRRLPTASKFLLDRLRYDWI